MRLEKRGRYYYAFWTERGVTRKRSTRCEKKGAAERVAARWELERADPTYAAANAATLSEEAAACIASRGRKLSAASVSMYVQKAGHLTRVMGADTKLAAVDPALVARYVAQREREGAAQPTIYKELVTLRVILKHAVHFERYRRDPRSLMPPGYTNDYTPRTRYLTEDELRRLVAACSPQVARLVALIVSTGMRAGEAKRYRPSDATDYTLRIRGTKTKAAARTIIVPSIFRSLFDFARAGDLPPYLPNANRDMKRACKRAGIPPLSMNDLRRTFASLLAQNGVPPNLIAKLLGHTTSAMAERVYSQTTHDAIGSLVEQALATLPDKKDVADTQPVESIASTCSDGVEPNLKSPQLYRLSYRPAPSETAADPVSGSLVAQPGERSSTAFPLAEATGVLMGLLAARSLRGRAA